MRAEVRAARLRAGVHLAGWAGPALLALAVALLAAGPLARLVGYNLWTLGQAHALVPRYQVAPAAGGYAARDYESLCAGRGLETAGSAPAPQTPDLLWQARWAFALCDRRALAAVAAAPPPTDSLARIFVAYAGWDQGDEARFRALLGGTNARDEMVAYAEDAQVAADWPRTWAYSRLATALGAADARIWTAYAESAMHTGQPEATIARGLAAARALAPQDPAVYELMTTNDLYYARPPDLAAGTRDADLACRFGLAGPLCHYLRATAAYLRGDWIAAAREAHSAQVGATPQVRAEAQGLEGQALLRAGTPAQAVPVFAALAAAQPGDAGAARDYALALLAAGRPAAAGAQCARIAALCPTCAQNKTFLRDLASLAECRR